MPAINFIKQIEILSCKFSIIYDKTSDAGRFSWNDATLVIGVKSYKKDPLYTLSIISHEVMEIILVGMGVRFASSRTGDNYLFSFDHQTFENAIQVHNQAMCKFIKFYKPKQ